MLYQVAFTLLIAMVAADSEPSFKGVSKGYGKGVSKGFSGKGFNGFNKGYNGFNKGYNGFNTGYNRYNMGHMGYNNGMMNPTFGFNGFNPGYNGFNNGYNGFNNGYNGFNNGYNGFKNGYNGFKPGYMGFNGFNGFNNGYNGYKKGNNMFTGGMHGNFGSPMGNGFNMNRRVYPGYPRFGGSSFSAYRPMGYFGDDDDYKFGGYFPGQFRRGSFLQRPSFGGYNSGYRGMSMKGPYQGFNMFRSSYPKIGYKSSMSVKKGSY